MLLLVGLMGMMVVGAAAHYGLDLVDDPGNKENVKGMALNSYSPCDHDTENGPEVLGMPCNNCSPPDEDTQKLLGDTSASIVGGLDGDDRINGGRGDDKVIDRQGDDPVIAGHDGIMVGGDGDDTIVLHHWLEQEHQAQVNDFSTEEDSLMVLYDDGDDPDPYIGIEPDEVFSDRQYVTLNGVRIASVDGAADLSIDHIKLVGKSALAGLVAA